MKRLLYVGNKLSKHGNTATSIETLGVFLESEGFEVYYASSKKNKILRMLDMIWNTLKYANKVDYVLIDTYSTINFWYAFIISQLCRLLSVKYITKLHGGNLPNRIKKSRNFCDMIFQNAHINVAPSNYLFKAFENNGYDKLIYIPNTIELQNYSFKKRESVTPKLLWVRSFAKIYNPTMAVKVLFGLKNEFPQAMLCMVGPVKDESYQETVQLIKELEIDVVFTEKLSKAEWAELSKQYDIFINTTHFDNTPVSVIEAMALGLPVVSTNVGGIPFLLKHQDNALLVPDNDVEKMINEIKKLLNNPKLARQVSENARIFVGDFDWEVVKKQWFELLK